MTSTSQSNQPHTRLMALLFSCVIGLAVVGYFVGLNDGVPIAGHDSIAHTTLGDLASPHVESNEGAEIPSMNYLEMHRSETGPTGQWEVSLASIPQPQYDPGAKIEPSDDDKLKSIATRSQRRAFNGAPPIIPHAIERTSDAACYACHGNGMRIGESVANRMSHGFLANCLQCHAPPPPKPFAALEQPPGNEFVGLPTPKQGKRAYPGAPPTIPHSTWMREQCLSCHGRQAGWAGLEVTHPWRTNCLQCHAPSAELEQAALAASPSGFVAPPNVKQP